MERNYSNFIEAYLEYSKFSEAPSMMHRWTAISTIAGALQGKVCINQGYFTWPANFYIIFVAPPGVVSKSTTANIGMDLLKEVPGVKFGPDVVTWQALAQAFVNSAEEYEINGEYEATASLTIASSEFGVLLNPNDRDMVNFLVHLWDGQKRATRKLTKTMGEDVIRNPWLNLIACTTPSWIADNFDEYFIGGGFVSRCVFVYADAKRHLVAYPGSVIPEGFRDRGKRLIYDLEVISQMKGEFTLTDKALAWGAAWYELHNEEKLQNPEIDPRMQSYYARKQTHIHKTAMILSAAESNEMVIEEEHLIEANRLLSVLEKDMMQVYNQVGMKDETKAASELLHICERKGNIRVANIYERFSRSLTATQFKEAIDSAVQTGRVKLHNDGHGYVLTYLGEHQ